MPAIPFRSSKWGLSGLFTLGCVTESAVTGDNSLQQGPIGNNEDLSDELSSVQNGI